MQNNPLRYSDPTGHMLTQVDGGCTSEEDCNYFDELGVDNKPNGNGWEIVIPVEVDDWLYENIPSVIGNQVGGSGQIGMGWFEVGMIPFEWGYMWNWRTGEISIIESLDLFGYTGSPSMVGGNVYVGATYVYGISDNQYLEGPALFTGASGSLDLFTKAGFSLVKGTYFEPEMTPGNEVPFIDPISEQTGTYYQASLSYGGNLMPNGVDGGFLYGYAGTIIRKTHQIPWWPRITSNR